MKKRILSLVLILIMCFSLVPSAMVRAAEEKMYVVKKGDSLYRIGKEYNVKWRDIAKLNEIKEPFTIYVGQELEIPLTTEEKAEKKALEKQQKKKETAEKAKDEAKNEKVQNEASKEAVDEYEEEYSASIEEEISEWAKYDILTGLFYNIYPDTNYADITAPVTKEQLQNLATGVNNKIKTADGVISNKEYILNLKDKMTVEEVLGVFYSILSSNEYSKDLGLNKRYSYLAYMREYGIYTGENGEQGLKDTCSLEQSCVIASRIIRFVFNELDEASKGLMWKVQSGDNTAYLLGSIHIANYDVYPFSNEILEAFKNSDTLVVEANILNVDLELSEEEMDFMYYRDGTTLKDHVSATTYEKTIKTGELLGMPEESLAMCKPWVITNIFTTLSALAGGTTDSNLQLSSGLGIDMYFLVLAHYLNKPIEEIEGAVKQLKVFDGFSDGLDEYLLSDTVDQINSALAGNVKEVSNNSGMVQSWLDYWSKGDLQGFQEVYNINNQLDSLFNEEKSAGAKGYFEEYINALFTERDKGMAGYIDNLLKAEGKNTYFVIVGALHYTNDYSVLNLLQEKGYIVTQVK